MSVNLAGFLDGGQVFGGYRLQQLLRNDDGLGNAGDKDLGTEDGTRLFKGGDRLRCGRFVDVHGHVKGEKVGDGDKPVHISQVDMVGIDQVWSFPSQGCHCRIGFPAGPRGFGVNDIVFAVALVPHRGDLHPLCGSSHDRPELGFPLVLETVTRPDTEFSYFHGALNFNGFQSVCCFRVRTRK